MGAGIVSDERILYIYINELILEKSKGQGRLSGTVLYCAFVSQ